MEAWNRAGFKASVARLRTICFGSGPLLRLGLLLHVGAQHRIHAPLITLALALEEIEHVLVDADGDRLFPRRHHQHGVRPVDIERYRIGIVGDRLGDVFIGQGIDARPVSLTLSAVAYSSDDDTVLLHLYSRDVLR